MPSTDSRDALIDAIERARLDGDEDVDSRYGRLAGRRGVSARRYIAADGSAEWTVALGVDRTCTVLDDQINTDGMTDAELAGWIERRWDAGWDELDETAPR